MSKPGDDRGTGTTPPEWWVKRFEKEYERRLAENEKAKSAHEPPKYVVDQAGLGKLLATIVGRESGDWHHSAVGNFINRKRYTREMAEAFSLLFEIPRFEVLVRPENEAKAMELEMLLGRHDLAPQPKVAARLAEIDQLAAALQESAEDQIANVKSKDERTDRGRRTGRTARRS